MMRKTSTCVAAVAITAAGLMVSSGPANAGPPTITNATAVSIHCDITGKAALSPGLKNNVKAADQTDPAVAALGDQQFASKTGVTTTAKSSGACTGSITDASGTYAVTAVKIASSSTSTYSAPDPYDIYNDGSTCQGLLTVGSGPNPQSFTSVVSFKVTGAKIGAVTVTSSIGLSSSVLGFDLTTTSVTGPISSSALPGLVGDKVSAAVDTGTITAITADPKDLTGAAGPCNATAKVKKGVATLKAPKGFSKIGLVSGSVLDLAS